MDFNTDDSIDLPCSMQFAQAQKGSLSLKDGKGVKSIETDHRRKSHANCNL